MQWAVFSKNLSMHNYADESAERFGCMPRHYCELRNTRRPFSRSKVLLQTAPRDPSYHLLKGQIIAGRGDYLPALKWLAAGNQ